MKEEQERWLAETLGNGVEVTNQSPDYMNVVVGQGCLGYTIRLVDNKNRQFNIVLSVPTHYQVGETSITLTIQKIFRYVSAGKEETIQSALIGRKVILAPASKSREAMNPYFFITGTLTLL